MPISVRYRGWPPGAWWRNVENGSDLEGKTGDIQQTPHCVLVSIHPRPVTEWEVRVPKEGDTRSPSWKSVFFPAPGKITWVWFFAASEKGRRPCSQAVLGRDNLLKETLSMGRQYVPFCLWQSHYCIWKKRSKESRKVTVQSEWEDWVFVSASVILRICSAWGKKDTQAH